jgi:hypothetical protein
VSTIFWVFSKFFLEASNYACPAQFSKRRNWLMTVLAESRWPPELPLPEGLSHQALQLRQKQATLPGRLPPLEL